VNSDFHIVAIYDVPLRATQQSDLLDVFRTLCSASQDCYLTAFLRCAQRG
jgi:hypothetical protein